ncbi:MAG: dTDP-4-amino-4,6-dideoxygalactose transaminase [Candidatus Azotimanducaceae bacterium]|jgi:dTDP-4-amino-4,6-dideoxygalactose transaminase
MLGTDFSPWPSFSKAEVDAVSKVLQSGRVNYWTGSETREFEKEFATATGSKHAIALANGTVALDLALKFCIKAGDDVIVTPRTFIASVSSVVNAGGRPVFADVDLDTQNITVESIAAVLTPKTTTIVVVHLGGMPADMNAIMRYAQEHGLRVIEDCAQAHGAMYKGRSVGSFGDVGAWSFCQDKIMTTGGEGGMVTTNSKDLWSKMWSYKDHGKSWDAVCNRKHPPGFRWVHESFGTNWRMTEMQSAIGRIQLRLLPEWHQTRLRHSGRIWETCQQFDWLRVPQIPADIDHGVYKAYVFVKPDRLPAGWVRDTIINKLLEEGIPAYSGSCSEVYLERAFDNSDFRPKEPLPGARALGETSLMFLCHPTLTDDEITRTCDALDRLNESIILSRRPKRKTAHIPLAQEPNAM